MRNAALPTSNGVDALRGPQVTSASSKRARIVRLDGRTGAETVEVDFPNLREPITTLAASSTHLAWVVPTTADKSELYVKNLRTGRTVGVSMYHAGPPTMMLELGDNAVVWGSGSASGDAGQFMLTLDDERLLKLGEAPGYSVAYTSGETLAWAKLSSGEDGAPITSFVTARYAS